MGATFAKKTEMNCSTILTSLYNEIKSGDNIGKLACYIPELCKIDPEKFGVSLSAVNGSHSSIGDSEEKFSIQSIAKVFSLVFVYRELGERLWSRLGVEPSGTAFNSLVQLEHDNGIPRNPFINAGALVVCDEMFTLCKDPYSEFLNFIREISDNQNINYSKQIADSEKSNGYRNVALCNFLKSYGNIKNKPEEVLDFYFYLCSIEMSCKEMSNAFLFLANGGQKISDGKEILNQSQTKRINAIMQTCGLYDESGEFTYRVGLPGKSGVGGGIVAVHPLKYAIAIWSPILNEKGNSYRGLRFLEKFTTNTQMSIF